MYETSQLFFSVVSLVILFDFSLAADSLTPNQTLADGQTLVSSGERFELGFFSPGNSSRRYLGIWYKKTPDVVVWVANRNNPIAGSSGLLTMSSDGELAILNQTRSIFWSSNLSKPAPSPVAQILDTGNFIVRDRNRVSPGSYIWQTFDYPTDTRLPGSVLGRKFNEDQDRFLSSWKSADDPSIGDFVYRFDYSGSSQIVIEEGSTRKYRTGPWNGLQFSGVLAYTTSSNSQFIMVFDKNKLCGVCWPYNSSAMARAVISLSGSLTWYVLDQTSNKWKLYHSVPNDPCDNYGQCGVNGFCRLTKESLCECLKGFTPKLPQRWELNDFAAGCVISVPLTCGKGDGFFKLVGVKMPDMLDVWLNSSMNLAECKTKCLNNCSCTAYTSSSISGGGSGCVLWFGDLIDIREFSLGNYQEVHVRLPASELGSVSTFSKRRVVMAVVLSASLGMLILGWLSWTIFRRKHMNAKGEDLVSFDFTISPRTTRADQIVGIRPRRNKAELEIPLFSFSSVSACTNNFSASNKLGEGGFGPVYKGHLQNGREVAIKRLSGRSKQGWDELKNEAMLIAKLQHKNLVKLLGCCIEGDENILIYEYLPNKSLDIFLFDSAKQGTLDWATRIHIIEGVAQGLLYLHEYSRLKIIHRDLKASNILLDKDMNPKISDFGMARIFGGGNQGTTNRIVGTYGYMAPEYALEGIFSVKSDIFSFGVLLLEILSGKKNCSFYQSDFLSLLGYAWDLWTSQRPLDLKDPKLQDMASELLIRYINIALLCVQEDAIDRPTMSDVVMMLSNRHDLPSPKRPAFSNLRSLVNPITYKSSSDIPSVNLMTSSIMDAR